MKKGCRAPHCDLFSAGLMTEERGCSAEVRAAIRGYLRATDAAGRYLDDELDP